MTGPAQWRSLLFVPVLTEKFLGSAARRGADAIQLDLEDSIPPADKQAAREAVVAAAEQLADEGCEVVVRINRPWRMAVRDMEASVHPAVCCLTLPKVPDAGHVRAVAEVLDDLERERGLPPGQTRLIAMIETAEGVNNAESIAQAHPRLCGMIVGAEDLAVDMVMRPTPDALRYANLRALTAARAAGIAPLGFVGSLANFSDLDALRARIEEARGLGFSGAFAIHPAQVAVMNEGFSPSREEVERAEGLIAAFEQALAQGRGTFSFEGKMIDFPVIEQARAVLAQRDAIAARHR